MAIEPLVVAKTSRVRQGDGFPAPVVNTEKAAQTEGNTFANTGKELLIVRNSDAADKTMKLFDKNGVQVGATTTLKAGKSYVFGPFPVFGVFGETVSVTFSHANVLAYVAQLDLKGVIAN